MTVALGLALWWGATFPIGEGVVVDVILNVFDLDVVVPIIAVGGRRAVVIFERHVLCAIHLVPASQVLLSVKVILQVWSCAIAADSKSADEPADPDDRGGNSTA